VSRTKSSALCAVGLLVAAAACGGGAEAGKIAGSVVEVAGAVTALAADGAGRRSLAVGDEVLGTDTIETGPDGRVTIRLRHNQALWSLGAGKSRRVDESVAWRAPAAAAGGPGLAERDRTAAAGRHAEREAAETSPMRGDVEDVDEDVEALAERPEPAAAPAPPPPPSAPEMAPGEDEARAVGEAEARARAEAQRRASRESDVAKRAAAEAARSERERAEVRRRKVGESGSGGVGTVGRGGSGGLGSGAGAKRSPASAVRATVEARLGSLAGPLDESIVRRMVRRLTPAFRQCYERELVADAKGARREVQLEVRIAPSGAVESATAVGQPDNLTRCLASRLRRARFPAADAATRAVYELTFQPRQAP